MGFDLNSFIDLLVGNFKGEKIPFVYYMILLIPMLTFFGFKEFAVKKGYFKENKKSIFLNFIIEIILSLGISIISLVLFENLLISIIFGIIFTLYLLPKLSSKSKKKDTKEEKSPAIENNVNVVINNNSEEKEDCLLPEFYDPNNLELPDNITSFNQLNIIMILEMYGYISPNQKFKMITQSLFETPDEQVEKLLKMYVLDKEELDEARAILNLIRLNDRLISKEEALHCIADLRNRQERNNKNEEKGE